MLDVVGALAPLKMLLQGGGGLGAVIDMDQIQQFHQRDLVLVTAEQAVPSRYEANLA